MAAALKLTQNLPNRMQSFVNIHIECKCAILEQMILYKPAILLHKLYKNESPEIEWWISLISTVTYLKADKILCHQNKQKKNGQQRLDKPITYFK